MFKALLRRHTTAFLSLLLTLAYAFAAPAQQLSASIQFLLSTQITHHGPNCWNSALVASGVLRHFRFTSPAEFRHLIDSPLCHSIPVGAQQPGDIQVYRRTIPGILLDEREVHANIWLDGQRAFNKKTDFSTAPYEITSHEKVFENYGFTAEILGFTDPKDPGAVIRCNGNTCQNIIEYRRCGNLENMKRQDPHYSVAVESLVSRLELAIQKQVRRTTKASSSWNLMAEQSLANLDAEIRSACGDKNSFYCEHSRHVLESLNWQVQRPQPNWLK